MTVSLSALLLFSSSMLTCSSQESRMSLNRRNAGVVAGSASALALCIVSSMMSPRSVVASETVSSRDGAARSPAASGEIARIHTHFDSVLRELDARPTVQLSPAQRKARLSLVSTLRGYNARGVFPRNYTMPMRQRRTLSIAPLGLYAQWRSCSSPQVVVT